MRVCWMYMYVYIVCIVINVVCVCVPSYAQNTCSEFGYIYICSCVYVCMRVCVSVCELQMERHSY